MNTHQVIFLFLLASLSFGQSTFLTPNEISDMEESFVKGDLEYVLLDYRVTWDEAVIICEYFKKGSLAIVNTNDIRDFLGEALSETNLEMEDLWIGARMEKGVSGFPWINGNGVYMPDRHFIIRGKENFQVNRSCLAFARHLHDIGTYINLECDLLRAFICEKEYEKIGNGSLTTPDWITVGRYKYGIFYDKKTWRQSLRDCRRKYNAHLASFRNEEEIAVVGKFLLVGRPSLENAWMGGYYHKGNWRFISNNKVIPDQASSNTSFPPWRPDRPRRYSGCLLLDRHLAYRPIFLEARCHRKRSYICSKRDPSLPDCSIIIMNEVGYIMYYTKKTWDSAYAQCQKIHAKLLKVPKKIIHDVTYIMGENVTEINHIWIGGRLHDNGAYFYWVDTKEIIPPNNLNISHYPPWFDNEYSMDYACLNMDRENHNRPMFYGAACDSPQCFICEQQLSKALHSTSPTVDIKEEELQTIEQIKEELPGFNLTECENLIKSNFQSDDESLNDLELPLSPTSASSETYDLPSKQSVTPRRNRRKALQPQRAVHSEISQSSSLGNSSECSQDASENTFLKLMGHENMILNVKTDLFMSDTENDLELPDSEDLLQDIDEENIFKGLQEETNGEKLDEEIIDNVKEEWRSHWGVKCNMCEQVFPYKMEFDKHYRNSYGIPPVYTCSFCNKTAEKYSTFRSHCYRHITEGRYKCQECPKGFSLQSMLHVHILSKHTKAKPFVCEECGKSFVTKPGLRIHLKKHKTETKEDYPCVECGKVLHTRGGLTSHMNVHRLGRRFMCDVCGKTFTQKVNMQQHVKQHTGDKPHTCDKCGKTFAEKSHLARHYSFHSNVRPYKCDVCQKMYKTERCLKVHSLVHAAARPFVCSYCSKGFLSSTKLKQHHNIHTGERPYACKYCERTFTNYPNWLKHTRRRHKVDHKTGEGLPPKVPKDETPPTPAATADFPPVPETPDPLMVDFITLSKSDELLLQQGLISLPSSFDERFMLPQQLDLLGGSSSNSNLIGPYLQMQLPGHQTVIPQSLQSANLQFSDIMHTSLLQQSLSCD